MPRCARIQVPGLPLHIVQRGVNRFDCLGGEADRRRYLELVEELLPRFACRLHAYVVMSNHVHLLLTADGRDGCSVFMKHLGQRYSQYFNVRYQRSGPLWEGRFYSSVVETDTYLLRCSRYIEENPLRAGMVRRSGEYRWSSYAVNAGAWTSSLVSPHPTYLAMGSDAVARCNAYRAMFREPFPDDVLEQIRAAISGSFPVGSPGFLEQLASIYGVKTVRARARNGGRPGAPAVQGGLSL